MTIRTQSVCSIILSNTSTVKEEWCVYEIYINNPAPMGLAPPIPELIYINSCKLVDVFRFHDMHNNSEFCRIAPDGVPILLTIVATTDNMVEARNHAHRHIMSRPVMPRCNLHGWDMHRANRVIVGSNGKTYQTQSEAADDIGATQGAISLHLKGKLKQVKGFTFSYTQQR